MRRILLFTFPLGFVLLAWWLMTRPPVEPVHGGKPLSVWLQEINSLELEATTASGIKLTTSNAPVNAVQSIGPAAIPWLRHELQAQEPLLHRLVSHLPVEWIYRLKLYRWLTPPVSPNSSERNRRAALAALILGPEARSLVPELAALLNSGKGHNFQSLALGRMGPDGVLPLAIAVTNQETQFSALYALELTDASTVAAVPALLCVLTNGGGYPSIQDKFRGCPR